MNEHTICPGEAPKQGGNPVRTGFADYESLGELVEECAKGWANPGRNSVVLLRALARLTRTHPEEAETGFTPNQLAELASELSGKEWVGKDDKEQVGRRVRLAWNQLEGIWAQKKEGIGQRAQDRGHTWVLDLDKKEGGGAGNPSRYFLTVSEVPRPTEEHTSGPRPDNAAPAPGTPIRYICEDVEDAGGIAAALARGYPLKGWRLGLFATLILGALVASFLIWFGLALIPMTRVPIVQVTTLAVFVYAAWQSCWRILTLGDYRIVKAPWWLQSLVGTEDRLLELRWHHGGRHPSIKAVRYQGECPLCAGKVTIHAGGFEFPGRLVGRCGQSPREHVFSFDHVLRRGRPLR